jgi:hypothetical protein
VIEKSRNKNVKKLKFSECIEKLYSANEITLTCYSKFYRRPHRSAMEVSSLFIMLLTILLRVSVVTFKKQSWKFNISSPSERGLLL